MITFIWLGLCLIAFTLAGHGIFLLILNYYKKRLLRKELLQQKKIDPPNLTVVVTSIPNKAGDEQKPKPIATLKSVKANKHH